MSYTNLLSTCNTKTIGQGWPHLPLSPSCLSLIAVVRTPTASVAADFHDSRASPSISQWQWWNDFRPEGFLDNSDERHRFIASHCCLSVLFQLQSLIGWAFSCLFCWFWDCPSAKRSSKKKTSWLNDESFSVTMVHNKNGKNCCSPEGSYNLQRQEI